MLSLFQPTPAAIQNFLAAQANLPLNYAAVGATGTTPPPGFTVDRTRVQLGRGDAAFAAAKAALDRWEQFRLGWVDPWPGDTPLRSGEVVAVRARVCGIWWLNACRIVYAVDEPRRYGFAYGTLPGHAESGEERFLVEQAEEGGVWYDIVAFSRPNSLLAWLGYPLTRRTQKRFARESAAAMARAVATMPA
jgi:uncharacterized protein (UPF0548 family)